MLEQVIYHSENEKYEMQMVVFRKKVRRKYFLKQCVKKISKSAVKTSAILAVLALCYCIVNYNNFNKSIKKISSTDNINMIKTII